ncbi:hypothetical protein [Laribacter hongkongensis]|nr:hypothetical protein [Laribacter hongkongensis]
MRRLCTLHELRTVYTLSDLLDFHDAIAEWDEAQRKAQERPPA